MTDDIPLVPATAVPLQRSASDRLREREAALQALAGDKAPSTPDGAAGALHDKVLLHTGVITGKKLLPALPGSIGGLVITGSTAGKWVKELRKADRNRLLLLDPEGYAKAAATDDEPFFLYQGENSLFPLTLGQIFDGQRACGATVAMTPTAYLRAGDSDALRAAVGTAGQIDRDDVIFSVPLDIAWLTDEHIAHLIAVLARLHLPKAVFLGGQFDPVERYRAVVVNLRRLMAEAGHVALFRTDLAGLDAVSHGAFAASIGSGGGHRHIVPFGEQSFARSKDPAPSVLFGDLMSWHKGSTIAERYGRTPAPVCACPPCSGRRLNTFLSRDDQTAAHQHSMCAWAASVPDLLRQPTLRDRATWWRNRCAAADAHTDVINTQLRQLDAFTTPDPVKAWADLPAWLTADQPTTRRSKTR